MLFEGTEKKLEVLVSDRSFSFRRHGRSFWDGVVRAAGAEILSTLSNDRGDAYLLSESSLFVFERRLLLITCGQTRLTAVVPRLRGIVPDAALASLIYERKNENFPELQPSTFEEDVRELRSFLPGSSLTFGGRDGHYLSLFHLDRPFEAPDDDTTTEVLMYDLHPDARRFFRRHPRDSRDMLRRALAEGPLTDFALDDHVFEPAGYSLNALDGDSYFTVHVTPNEIGSYASFETNVQPEEGLEETVNHILEIFRPRRTDVVQFQGPLDAAAPEAGYALVERSERTLSCGYRVDFGHFEAAGAADPALPGTPPREAAGGVTAGAPAERA